MIYDISREIKVTDAATAVNTADYIAIMFTLTKTSITTLPTGTLTESSDDSTYTDIADTDLIYPDAFTSAGKVNIGYTGSKKYVKVATGTGVTVPQVIGMLKNTI